MVLIKLVTRVYLTYLLFGNSFSRIRSRFMVGYDLATFDEANLRGSRSVRIEGLRPIGHRETSVRSEEIHR